MKMTATAPSSAAEIVADPAAFLRAIRAEVPDFDYAAAAAVADALAEEEMLGEMVSYRGRVTGMTNTIFLSQKGRTRHGPRVKVAVDPPTSVKTSGDHATVTFDGDAIGRVPTDVLKQVRAFIDLNRAVLVDYWEERISTDELAERLRSI